MTDRTALIVCAAIVVLLKLLQWVMDSTPIFFMGDSGTYIKYALGGYPPMDRSATYGWLIRWTAVVTGSLHALMAAQILAGAATAWLLSAILLRYFQVRRIIAVLAGVAFALDPLQILHERLVMAEVFALLMLALLLWMALAYLREPRLLLLIGVCMTGILLSSLRFMFVPVVLSLAVLLPLLGLAFSPGPQMRKDRFLRFLVHTAVGIVASGLLHAGYRHEMGHLTGREPAYHYSDGLMLMASWAPLLTPEDAIDPRAAGVIARQAADDRFPLWNRWLREAQLWSEGGLVDRLTMALGGDYTAANHTAKEICGRVLRREPWSVFRLAFLTFRDFWRRPAERHGRLVVEQGADRPLERTFVELLSTHFRFDGADSHADSTLSRRYHLAAGWWYLALLISPLAWFVSVGLVRPAHRGGAGLMFLTGMLLLAVICTTSAQAVYRYLHPFSLMGIMGFGVLANAFLGKMEQAAENSEGSRTQMPGSRTPWFHGAGPEDG